MSATIELLQCADCDEVFELRDAHCLSEPVASEFWGARAVTTCEYLACPRCGSDQVADYEEDVT
ncbi:MAG TPA: hypothetical protein VF193_00870 [Steroidobacter sp.]